MKTTLAALVLPIAVGAVALGCNHPNRLDIPRANAQRDIISSKTPQNDEHVIEGEVKGEPRKLSKWAKRAAPGDTIECKLGPGVYVIDDPILIRGVSLVIAGSGVEKTRIKLHSDDWRALTVRDCPNFELRGVTVAGYSGGGIDVHDCARVVVNDCDFVGARYGLELDGCTAYVDSCVFAGDEVGLQLDGAGSTILRGSCFAENWWSIRGAGRLEALGCAFLGNEKGAEILASSGTVLRSVLVAHGDALVMGGKPKFERCLLGPEDLLEPNAHRGTAIESKPIMDMSEFPEALPYGPPPECDLGAIQYALARYRLRGTSNATAKIDDALRAQADYYAAGARRAVEVKQMGPARELARFAHTYVLAMSRNASRDEFKDIEALAVSE